MSENLLCVPSALPPGEPTQKTHLLRAAAQPMLSTMILMWAHRVRLSRTYASCDRHGARPRGVAVICQSLEGVCAHQRHAETRRQQHHPQLRPDGALRMLPSLL